MRPNINEISAHANLFNLALNSYIGPGMVIGMDESGKNMVQVYWIMGRSKNSRNRVFGSDANGRLFTEAVDPAEMKDTSLVIYNAMIESSGRYIVSNGDQTDDIANTKPWRYSFQNILSLRQYEPNAPNFTPRISGQCVIDKTDPIIQLSILRKSLFSNACDRVFYNYDDIAPGYGYCITTYAGDGNPLPSWNGDPLLVPLPGSIMEIATTYMEILNEDHFVSLAVKFIPIDGGRSEIYIINKYCKDGRA